MTATAPRTTATGRLGNGELRRQVAAWLDGNPGAHTPGTIARALDRSAGAVGNALTTLAGRCQAELVPGKPARYQATPATRAAAGGISAAPAPRPPASPRPGGPAPAAPSGRPAGRPPSRARTVPCTGPARWPTCLTRPRLLERMRRSGLDEVPLTLGSASEAFGIKHYLEADPTGSSGDI